LKFHTLWIKKPVFAELFLNSKRISPNSSN
jgi:hypothetical protein